MSQNVAIIPPCRIPIRLQWRRSTRKPSWNVDPLRRAYSGPLTLMKPSLPKRRSLKPSGMAGGGSEGLMADAWAWTAMDTTTAPANALRSKEDDMNEETFNISIRKFLKMVGVSSQREIEQAVQRAIASGAVKGSETLPATVRLEVAGLKLDVRFDGRIQL